MTNAVNLASAASTGFTFRNRIINGDMRIDQRNNGASATVNNGGGNYTIDRWQGSAAGGGVFTMQRSSVVPDGTPNSLAVTVTTVDSSVAASDYYTIQQYIEGFNVADFNSGTAAAKSFTVSFKVRSSVTGSYTATIMSSDGQRAYRQLFTIPTANVFQMVTLTFPGDTSGNWYTDNRTGMMLFICLGSGSTFTGSAGSWAAGNYVFAATGQTNWISTAGATFYIADVQLEVGSVATPFERRPYGFELALCQRYYQTYPNTITYRATPFSSSFAVRQTGMLCVPMRAAPSVTVTTSGIGNQNTTTTVIGTFNTHVQFEAVTPNSSAWGNPHYDVAYNASAEL